MLGIVGTVPEKDFPLLQGKATYDGNRLLVAGREIEVNRGTPALLAAACQMSEVLGLDAPTAFLSGDIGLGHGSRELYSWLAGNVADYEVTTLAFHYLQPDVDGHSKVLLAVQEMASPPRLIADAGFMYAAKMSGQSLEYELFTPDAGELAFLADEKAPHPFYTRGFILAEDNDVPELIALAYRHDNAARYLLVKGENDLIADKNGVLFTVNHPQIEAMEAMGGTGDTLTGIVSSLIEAGMNTPEAARLAASVNRTAGAMSDADPASQIMDIIPHLPQAYRALISPPKDSQACLETH
jgi:NAD(P)H-hydrate repair Nnr-like enzyme with NAD(P)H-hydrate dehydratase domain